MEPERQFPLFRQEADQIRKLTMEFSRLKNNLLVKNKFTKKTTQTDYSLGQPENISNLIIIRQPHP
ncbi:hypothetical protein C8R30_102154 [Nitrosomonas nitrosa]|uniref:Uncharacterized protein n=1 Tax=Nitrosomonas nitrosa TaxID=52442 RepID=A0A1I4KYL1_9PROT|nr:hypothetical protein C8R30_102154 [Nitrosomonas nitrosa]SFL83683.1 hypothetical protein SAMN05421880_10190 [Nitrosomonas nitrosa]